MIDSPFSHLYAIEERLDHERARVVAVKTAKERTWREHNVRMIEREVTGEIKFLADRGIVVPTVDMDDDALLAELLG